MDSASTWPRRSIKSDDSREAIGGFGQSVRGWSDETYPEAVLVVEWSLPEVALRAGFHVPPVSFTVFRSR